MGGSMLHHVMLKVGDWPKARDYYVTTLKELGYTLALGGANWGGFKAEGDTPGLYIRAEADPKRSHLALRAPSSEAVKAYHATALAAGGKDNGAPGPRSHIANNGIGAFVIDPWDNNIEVVFEPSS